MNHNSIRKFGLAFGLTGALLYFSCAFVMLILGRDSSIEFFNPLFYNFDITSIIEMIISPVEEILGHVRYLFFAGPSVLVLQVFTLFRSMKITNTIN